MYVQVRDQDDRTTLYDTGRSEVTTGGWQHREPVSAQKVLDHLDLATGTVVHFHLDENQPMFAGNDDGPEGWDISYAYWWDWESGFLRLVVGAHPLYVLGDNGKTLRRA